MVIEFEKQKWSQGENFIAGLDEVGRGCLAGPLVTAVVILNKEHYSNLEKDRNNDVYSELIENYSQIKDSKLLSKTKREQLSEFISKNSIEYNVSVISWLDVDKFGIARATQNSFEQNIDSLKSKVDHFFVDAFKIKKFEDSKQTNIIKGDNKSITIAAASIIGKVYRDSLMEEYAKMYPIYEFENNKGYGTKLHMEKIREHGICEIHRKSFEPIKTMLNL